MGKLIVKTAAVTFSLLVAVALMLFGIVSLSAPAAMMELTDSLGMNGASAYYSVAVYDRSGDISDLAVAVEKSYDVGHYTDAAEYGQKMLGDDAFAEYCAARDEDTEGSSSILGDYRQYATGMVASAEYFCGEKDAALDIAFAQLGKNSFPANNAFMYLRNAAVQSEDKEFCGKILERCAGITPQDAQDVKVLQNFLDLLRADCA